VPVGGLDDYAQALGAAQQLVPNWRQSDLVEARLQGERLGNQGAVLQNQAQQIAINDHQRQTALAEQRRVGFQADLGALGAKPTPLAYQKLAAKYPEFHQALDQVAKGIAGEQAQSLVKRLAPIQSLISGGFYDEAAKQVRRHIDADVAAGGQPDEDDQALLDSLQSGDSAKQKAAGGLVSGLLYQLDPEHAAKSLQEGGENANHFVALGDGQVLNQRTGEVTGERREKPEYRTVDVFDADGNKIGERVISLGTGGGGQASSGGAAGTKGDVSRLINTDAGGGQVPDSVKTLGQFVAYGKSLNQRGARSSSAGTYQINGSTMAEFGPKALGVDWRKAPYNADTQDKVGQAIFDWAKQQPDPAKALRGRWVSLSPQSAAQLVQGSWQQARDTIAQGETGGGARASAARSQSAGNGSVVYESVGTPGAKANGDLSDDALERAAIVYGTTGQIPTGLGRQGVSQRAILNKWAQIASKGGVTPEQQIANWQDFKTHQQGLKAFARGPEARTVRSLNVTIDHLDTLQNAAQALQNGNIGIFNRVRQSFARATGSAVPTNFEGVRQIVSAEVAKAITGGNTALADRQDLAHSISTANSPQQLAGYIAEVKKLMTGQLQGLAGQYKSATGRDDFESRLSPRTRHQLRFADGNGASGAGTGFRVLRVRPK
jgi:hypothetical protein